MKRDMDVVRSLLQQIEATKEGYTFVRGIDAQHAAILIDAGLIHGHLHRSDAHGVMSANIERLTWSGLDFLDSMREDTLRNKAKERVLVPGVSWTFDILKEWLKFEAKKKLGISDS